MVTLNKNLVVALVLFAALAPTLIIAADRENFSGDDLQGKNFAATGTSRQ